MRFNGLDLHDMCYEIEDVFGGDWYIYKVTGSKSCTMAVHFVDDETSREIVWRNADEDTHWEAFVDGTLLATAPSLEFLHDRVSQ